MLPLVDEDSGSHLQFTDLMGALQDLQQYLLEKFSKEIFTSELEALIRGLNY